MLKKNDIDEGIYNPENYFYHLKEIPSYDDIVWDTLLKEKRDEYVLSQAKNTAIYAKLKVPFYREHYKDISVKEILAISSIEEFSCRIPQITKEHLSQNNSILFMPDDFNLLGMRNFGTGGTTGKPVTVWYSKDDWRAASEHIARSIKYDFRNNLEQLKDLFVFGMYHGDHITNHLYKSGLELLGVHLLGRASTKQNIDHNYELLQGLKPNGILAPPEDKTGQQTKGILLDTMLVLDAKNSSEESYRLNNRENPNFRMILWSSLPLSKHLYGYIKNNLGIEYIQGQYGSTECAPTGATCEYEPLSFHLGYGPNLVSVVHPSGKRLVREGELGYLLVTKTAGRNHHGKNIVPTGTFLINFRIGDFAELKNVSGEKCQCGRNTPIIKRLVRVENLMSKAKFGCQAD